MRTSKQQNVPSYIGFWMTLAQVHATVFVPEGGYEPATGPAVPDPTLEASPFGTRTLVIRHPVGSHDHLNLSIATSKDVVERGEGGERRPAGRSRTYNVVCNGKRCFDGPVVGIPNAATFHTLRDNFGCLPADAAYTPGSALRLKTDHLPLFSSTKIDSRRLVDDLMQEAKLVAERDALAKRLGSPSKPAVPRAVSTTSTAAQIAAKLREPLPRVIYRLTGYHPRPLAMLGRRINVADLRQRLSEIEHELVRLRFRLAVTKLLCETIPDGERLPWTMPEPLKGSSGRSLVQRVPTRKYILERVVDVS